MIYHLCDGYVNNVGDARCTKGRALHKKDAVCKKGVIASGPLMVRVRSSPMAIAVDRRGACLYKTPGVFSTQQQLFTIDSIYAYTPIN